MRVGFRGRTSATVQIAKAAAAAATPTANTTKTRIVDNLPSRVIFAYNSFVMNRFLIFIALTISLFAASDLNAQNYEFRNAFIGNKTITRTMARLITRTKYSELDYVLSKSTEYNSGSHSEVKELKDSSIVILKSGTKWMLNKRPQKPLFYSIKVLTNSQNDEVADYYRFVVFCKYFKKTGDLNYKEIDYVSMDKEFLLDNGVSFPMKYIIRFSAEGKPTVY